MIVLLTVLNPDATCDREFLAMPNRPQLGECLRLGARVVQVRHIVHETTGPSIATRDFGPEPRVRDFGAEIICIPIDVFGGCQAEPGNIVPFTARAESEVSR